MAFYRITILLCLASLYMAECRHVERNKEVKAGILSLCNQFIPAARINKFICFVCKGFDGSCFNYSTTVRPTTTITSSTSPATTTSSSTKSTTSPSTTSSSTSSTTAAPTEPPPEEK